MGIDSLSELLDFKSMLVDSADGLLSILFELVLECSEFSIFLNSLLLQLLLKSLSYLL